jgi:peptidoglycan/xylan/chitin deacetylase (PgdA/CDA1 family)
VRLAAVSIDLDEIPNYFAIHGLAAPRGAGATAVYDVALPRLDAWASALDVPLTLFAIGADMARPESALALRQLAARHEIGNHTLDHLYDLTRRSRDEITRQVMSCAMVLEGATGQRPRGFRAPGYTVTDELFGVLEECGVVYDSSVFPSPPYYALKAAARAAMRVRGRRSRSILDNPAVLLAPSRPYHVGRPYWKRGQGMLELPIQVTRGPRLPFIGTTLTVAGPDGARRLAQLVLGEPLVNLELHGLDALDTSDGLEELRAHQHDVRIAVRRKLDALSAVIELLRGDGYAFVRLEEAAAELATSSF